MTLHTAYQYFSKGDNYNFRREYELAKKLDADFHASCTKAHEACESKATVPLTVGGIAVMGLAPVVDGIAGGLIMAAGATAVVGGMVSEVRAHIDNEKKAEENKGCLIQ